MTTGHPVPKAVLTCLEDLTRFVQAELGDNLWEVRLFGSYARGQAGPDSDVDVLVVVRNLTLPVKDRILEIMSDVSLDHELVLGPLVWDLEHLRQHELLQTLLIRNIKTEGVAVWIHP